ncbi:caspase family protein [Methylocapsa acidiphila]|uniref:caspase family protein n=1 Tax=Methylocapsa acidiphila TaxID=133552 RepID=UPI00041A405C|nr:caspase family protein [Methylocapsa acidiphila]
MNRLLIDRLAIAGLALLLSLSSALRAQEVQPRLALVIGNADYRSGALPTAANDAGLVAETLRAEGFEVMGAANLDQDSLRRAFRDFLAKAAQAGPDAIAFVYLSGRGLQYEGENYFAPIEAVIARDSDVPLEALRISDFTRALASLPLRARIVVLDAARANAFAQNGRPLAGGLALVDAEPGSLYAFNAAPGTIAPDEAGPYGAYASALAEMLRSGGLPIDEAFARVRLRVDQATRGAFLPWDASKIAPPVVLLPPDPKAPPPVAAQSYAVLQARPIREFPVEEAYAAAIERDTIAGYQDFIVAYPDSPLTRRMRTLLAARREALTWRRALEANAPDAYWTYIHRYPRGPHVWDARRRLAILSAPLEPPPRFEVYDFGGLPPPPPVEYEIVDRPVIMFDPGDYPPPPPPPVYFLPPPPVAFIELAPPPPPPGPGFLPIPTPIPLPYARPNAPQGVVIQQNFGQQGPVGGAPPSGQGPGPQGAPGRGPLPGQPHLPPTAQPPGALPPGASPAPGGNKPLTPPIPGAPALAPGAAQPPGHALPQGHELPPVGAPAPGGAPQTGKPGAPAQPPAAGSVVKPASPTIPGASGTVPGAAQPGHALPQGHELPPAGAPASGAPPQGTKPGTAPSVSPGSVIKPTSPTAPGARGAVPGGAAQPGHALPQGHAPASESTQPEIRSAPQQPHPAPTPAPELRSAPQQPHPAPTPAPELRSAPQQPRPAPTPASELRSAPQQPHPAPTQSPEMRAAPQQPHPAPTPAPEMKAAPGQPHQQEPRAAPQQPHPASQQQQQHPGAAQKPGEKPPHPEQ